MQKLIITLLAAMLLLSSCSAAGIKDNEIDESAAYNETISIAKPDNVGAQPSDKVEALDNWDDTYSSGSSDPASIPANAVNFVDPSEKISIALPDTVKTPMVSMNSNGISQLISSLNVSNNQLTLYQSTGDALKTDTSALKSLIDNYDYDTSILAIRISDGSYIAYNIDQYYSCASTIKAPYSMYVYRQIANGYGSLTDTIQYQSYHYMSGSGVIKYSEVGTTYTVQTLLEYSMLKSDNIAYNMLHSMFGNNISEMLSSAGAKTSMSSSYWPPVSARDAAIWWNEIFQFKDSCSEGQQLFNLALSNSSPILYNAIGYNTPFANKSGWVDDVCHEAGIIMTDDPYILIVLTTKSSYSADTYTSHIVNVVREVDKIMRNY